MSILLKPLIFLSLLFIYSYAKRPFADTEDDVNPSVNEKFEFSVNVFHGFQGHGPKPEDSGGASGSYPWFKNPGGLFGSNKVDPGVEKPDFETKYLGKWKVDNPNVGVEAMQLQLMPNNKVIWIDTTALGDSALHLDPPGYCPKNFENTYDDCFAHGLEYDIQTAKVRPLKVASDPWCSSGVLAPNGDLVNTGGYNKGVRAVRIFSPCPTCEFKEAVNVTAANRWYSSNQVLDDGSFIIVGGRLSFNYEVLPPDTMQFPIKLFGLQFLSETNDEGAENNLYPFIFLLPDGNTFIFANNRSIIIQPKTGKFVRELPVLPGGSRNYPASGSAVLLPLKLSRDNSKNIEVEVLVCGGNHHEAFKLVENKPDPQKNFMPALQDCGRISVTKKDAQWEIEKMPSPRVMGDMFTLPNGEVLIINGAKKGTAGWWDADEPNFTPVLYSPKKASGERFKELAPTTIPRMYHSAGAVLPDGRVLIAGSNPNNKYSFNVKYVTELRVETFYPPYLDPALSVQMPVIIEGGCDKKLKYGQSFNVQIKLNVLVLDASILKVTMYAPPFTTHAFSQNQRLLVLGIAGVANNVITAVAPPSGKIAPPGYYILFVVHRGVPSRGIWVHIQK